MIIWTICESAGQVKQRKERKLSPRAGEPSKMGRDRVYIAPAAGKSERFWRQNLSGMCGAEELGVYAGSAFGKSERTGCGKRRILRKGDG